MPLSVTGEAYLAFTPSCLMAGLKLAAVFETEISKLRSWPMRTFSSHGRRSTTTPVSGSELLSVRFGDLQTRAALRACISGDRRLQAPRAYHALDCLVHGRVRQPDPGEAQSVGVG